MLFVDFYTKENCLLCEEALTMIETLQSIYPFQVNICDIHEREEWLEKYFLTIPVVDIGGTIFMGEQVNFSTLEQAIKEYV